jgi:hypothetical protein
MELKYFYYKLKMFIIAFIILGALNTASSQIKYDFIKIISDKIKNSLNLCFDLEYYFYILTGIFAVIIAMDRNTWLPFLGESVLPSIFVPLKINNGNKIIKVNVTPNTKVAYWSTLLHQQDPIVNLAYKDYSNSGVVMSDKNGVAILTFNKGSGYYLPNGKHLNAHVHYREIGEDLGMIGPIQTYYL